MAISIVNQNGEVKIPPDLLGKLHLHAGDKIELRIEQDGSLRLLPKKRSVAEVKGMLAGKTAVHATIEDMNNAVAEGFRTGNL